MRKNITSILLAAMILSLTACAQGNTSGSGESNSSAADTSAHSTADTSVSESVPETSSNESTPDTSVSESTPDTSVSEVTTADTTVSESAPEDIPEVWNPAVIQRQVMLDEGYMCGVAYLGYVDGEADISECRDAFYRSMYAEDFEFVRDIPDENVINAGNGNELYLIIPQDVDSSVAVNEFVFAESEDGISVETGEVYYRSDIGAPILLKCNVSDIVPSAVISIVDSNGNILEYSPSISLKDGSVSRHGAEDKVMDFTHYIYNESFESYIPQSDGVG